MSTSLAPFCLAKRSWSSPEAAGRRPGSLGTEPGVARGRPAASPGGSKDRPRAPQGPFWRGFRSYFWICWTPGSGIIDFLKIMVFL